MKLIRKVSRRALFKAGGGLLLLGVLGAGWAVTAKEEDYLVSVLKFVLDDEDLDETPLRQSAQAYLMEASPHERSKIRKLVKAARFAGTSVTDQLLADWRPYDYFKRRLVTYFILRSNYLDKDKAQDALVFYGPELTCGNPFARFL